MSRFSPRHVVVAQAGAIILACAVLVPFLNKAFTIDDTNLMRQAERALRDPVHPTLIDTIWADVPMRPASTSGPGMAWLLVPAAWAGGSEVVAHLIQLLGFALAIASTVSLASRLGLSPPWAGGAGFLLSATPAAIGMAGTAMADVWAMAFAVLGVDRVVAWRDEGRWHQGALAALSLAYGALTRSHVLLVVGVAALLIVRDPWLDKAWWQKGARRWTPIIAAPVLFALVLWVTRDPNPENPGLIGGTGSMAGLEPIPGNLVAFATHWALVLPLALPWALLRARHLLARWWLLCAAPALLAGLLAVSPWTLPDRWYVALPFASLSVAVLWDILAEGWSSRNWATLTLGVWLLVGLAATPYAHVPSKYLLVSAPAAAILVAQELSRQERSWSRWVLALTCAAGITLGVAILRADQRFGDLGRSAAATIIAPPVAAGQRVWFGGHWGFQWYAERAGGRILTLTPPYPRPGDLIVVSHSSELSPGIIGLLSEYPTIVPVARAEDRTPGGRVMSAGAGFFSNGWGLLPWVWDDGPVDTIDVMLVK